MFRSIRGPKIMITTMVMAAALLLTGAGLPVISAFASPALDPLDQYGIYYRHGRVFGKLIHYDRDRDLGIIYGSVFVSEADGEWRLVESQKFHLVNPVGNDIRKTISEAVGKTMGVEGELQVWPGQKEEIMAAGLAEISNYKIDTPPWYAFGKTIRSERIYKFNLNTVTDFINVPAGIQNAANIPQHERMLAQETAKLGERVTDPKPQDRALANTVRNEFEKAWNEKWCVVKDQNAANDMRLGVGGWQIYCGFLGYGNSYISKAPLIRKDIVKFMDVVKPGGGSPEESGEAVMCAYIEVERDKKGNIIRAMTSGALYESVEGLISAMENPSILNLETWRLEGGSEKDLEIMENKLCWLSGRRVLVYKTDPETGESYLADQYFSLDKYLTRAGFENVLDFGNYVIGGGGV